MRISSIAAKSVDLGANLNRVWTGEGKEIDNLFRNRVNRRFGFEDLVKETMNKTIKHVWGETTTSFPGLQCEDEAKHEEALVWASQVCILIG
jgi:hypothetical protein